MTAREAAGVSTGRRRASTRVQTLIDAAHERFRDDDRGANASHYPALASVPRDLFGICVAGVDGTVMEVGDSRHPFTIMSVAKPFVLALVIEAIGADEVRDRVGVDATGLPFDSVMALELHPRRLTNPMVNTGALATTSLVPGDSEGARWARIVEGISAFAGRPLQVDEEVLASASATNHRNRGLARFLEGYGRLGSGAVETVELYTRQSCLSVTARDLAVMGATLADGGVNPVSGERVVSADTCRHVLAVMATAGMYEASGRWLYDVGMPGKSGVGGGIVTVAPGRGGLGTFSPPLDEAGNSIRGVETAVFLADALGLGLFTSGPDARTT